MFEIPQPTTKELTLLTQKQIDNGTAIIKDFNFLLNYIENNTLEATKKGNFFVRKNLSSINENLTSPITIESKAPNQKHYPHIDGLYLLLASMGIVWFKTKGKKKFFALNSELLVRWRALNPTEQYFTLLEIWFFNANASTLNEFAHNLLYEAEKKLAAIKNRMGYVLEYDLYLIALMEMFEFIETENEKEVINHWNIKIATSRPFADAIVKLVHYHRYDILESESLGSINQLFKPYFQELEQKLIYPEKTSQRGVLRFKVKLWRATVWLEADATTDLETFANAILNAFDFDNEHLYCFEYKDCSNRFQRVFHSYMEIEVGQHYCYEVKLGDLDISTGSELLFLFDFGDNWEFNIVVEAIESERTMKGINVVKSEGEPPEQYSYEEWE